MTYAEDFRIDKWGGPNQGTGGTHWTVWHLPTGRKMGDFNRKRDATELIEALLPLADDMRRVGEMGPGTERLALIATINERWAQR